MAYATHNLDSAVWTPQGGQAVTLSSLGAINRQEVSSIYMAQSDVGRTIMAAYADALYERVTINFADATYVCTPTNFKTGLIGKLVVKQNLKAQGGAPSATKQITFTYANCMVEALSNGMPSQGLGTQVLSFLAYDPAGIKCVDVVIGT